MPGTVTVQATFVTNSLARGFLVILVDTRDTAMSVTSTLRPNHTVVISELATADSYTVVVFDVENTGLPSTRAAAVDVVNVTSTEPIAGSLWCTASNDGRLCGLENGASGNQHSHQSCLIYYIALLNMVSVMVHVMAN